MFKTIQHKHLNNEVLWTENIPSLSSVRLYFTWCNSTTRLIGFGRVLLSQPLVLNIWTMKCSSLGTYWNTMNSPTFTSCPNENSGHPCLIASEPLWLHTVTLQNSPHESSRLISRSIRCGTDLANFGGNNWNWFP